MTGPAHTNTTTTAAEVLAETLWDMRRHIGLVVADWPTCVETAERHPGSPIARRVAEHRELVVAVHERLAAAGLLADPTTRTASEPTNWHATHWHLTDGRCVSPDDEVTYGDRIEREGGEGE